MLESLDIKEINLGSPINVKPSTLVSINSRKELVLRLDENSLHTLTRENNEIIEIIRSLNSYRLHDFDTFSSYTRYNPHSKLYKGYDTILKKYDPRSN